MKSWMTLSSLTQHLVAIVNLEVTALLYYDPKLSFPRVGQCGVGRGSNFTKLNIMSRS